MRINSKNLFFAAAALTALLVLVSLCFVSARRSHLGRVPRQIPLSETELGPVRTITGRTASGAKLYLAVRPYTGSQTGHWGSEKSPPVDVLWSLEFTVGEDHVEIPPEYLRDLAGVAPSPHTKTIESFNAVNPERLCVSKHGNRYEVRLEAGDAASAYQARLDVRLSESGEVKVVRTVKYHLAWLW